MTRTPAYLRGLAGAFAAGKRTLPAGLRVVVIVTEVATGRQGVAVREGMSMPTAEEPAR